MQNMIIVKEMSFCHACIFFGQEAEAVARCAMRRRSPAVYPDVTGSGDIAQALVAGDSADPESGKEKTPLLLRQGVKFGIQEEEEEGHGDAADGISALPNGMI